MSGQAMWWRLAVLIFALGIMGAFFLPLDTQVVCECLRPRCGCPMYHHIDLRIFVAVVGVVIGVGVVLLGRSINRAGPD